MATEDELYQRLIARKPELAKFDRQELLNRVYARSPKLKGIVTKAPAATDFSVSTGGTSTIAGIAPSTISPIAQGPDVRGAALSAAQVLPTAGAIVGSLASTVLPPPMRAGVTATTAAGGEAMRQIATRALGGGGPSSAEAAKQIAEVGAAAGASELLVPIGLRYAGKGLGATRRLLGAGIKKTVSGLSTVSTDAIDAAMKKGDRILKYVGLSADELADKGQEIQSLIKQSKGSIDDSIRDILGKRYDALKSAETAVGQHLDSMRRDMVFSGQELQKIIPTIKEKAGEEYRGIIKKALSKSGKYKLDPGAAYPFTLDFRTGMANTIKQVRDDFGYGIPSRNPDPASQQVFNDFVNRITNMDRASIDDAYYLQKDLGNAINRHRGTEAAAALRSLRDSAFKVMDDVPEFKQANAAYKSGMDLLDDLSGMTSADDLSKTIIQAFKTGGNKQDALMRFGAVNPAANKLLKNIVSQADEFEKISAKGQTISKMAQGIEKLKDTYTLGDAKKVMTTLSQRDPVIKNILKMNADPEEMYGRLSALMNTDRVYSRIMTIMSKGGNQKDALTKLAKEVPGLESKISEIQDAILGQEFKPLFRSFPQTGMGVGLMGGIGAAATQAPAALVAAPLLSPRLVGMGAKATGEVARAAERAFLSPASKAIGAGTERVIRPLPGTLAYELLRRRNDKK